MCMFNVGYYFNAGMMKHMNIGGNMMPYEPDCHDDFICPVLFCPPPFDSEFKTGDNEVFIDGAQIQTYDKYKNL